MVPAQSVTLGLWTSPTEQLYRRPMNINSFMSVNSALLTRCDLILISYVTTSFEFSFSSSDEYSCLPLKCEHTNVATINKVQKRTREKGNSQQKMTIIAVNSVK